MSTSRHNSCFVQSMPLFVSWILAAWTTMDSKLPIVSTTMCRLRPFVFFLHRSLVLHLLLPSWHSANRQFHNLAFRCVRNPFVSFLPSISGFCPIIRWFLLDDRNCEPLNTAENHGVDSATCNRCPPNTVLHLSVLTCSIRDSSFLYTTARFLTIVHLSNHLDMTCVLSFQYPHFTRSFLWIQPLSPPVGVNSNVPLVAENAVDTVFVELIAVWGLDMVCIEASDNVRHMIIKKARSAKINWLFTPCFNKDKRTVRVVQISIKSKIISIEFYILSINL